MSRFISEEHELEIEQPARGFRLVVSGRSFFLGSAIEFNAFQNEVAKIGDYKNILNRRFDKGKIIFGYEGELTPTKSSVALLKREVDELWEKELSDTSLSILSSIRQACYIAIRNEEDITIK